MSVAVDRHTPSGAIRIALLSPCFWPEVRRGAERFARELADQLLARGHRPRLITSHPGLPTRTTEQGLEITRHWRPPPERWLRRHGFLEYLTHVPLSYASLRAGQYDVAQALYASDALAAAAWAERTGRPSILSYMGVTDRSGLTDRRLRLEVTYRAARRCTAVTALSRAAAAAFTRWLGIEARVIYPPVDIEAFTPGGDRTPEPTIVCAAAVEEPRKRVGLLIAAFRELRRHRPDARLLLNRPRDRALVERLRATEPGIELLDLDDRAALRAAYRGAWLAVLPSFGEAFGLVLAEALACGTPVVGGDSGGIPEIIDRPEIGRVFPVDDEAALVRALLDALELSEDPGTPRACRARAEDFSATRCAAAYEELYRELLA
jgi:glycosyltransferase involved in cell wall biosynthesis